MASENKKRKQANSPFCRSAIKEKGTMRMKRELFYTPSTRQEGKRKTRREIQDGMV